MNPTLESLMRTIWGMIALTTIVFLVRGIIRFKSSHRIAVADCVLLLAYLCFLALAILYLETIGAMYRWQSALSGETPVYPEYASDLVIMRKAMLINAYLLWCTLWSVKFAFLALYWRLVQQQPRFVKIWWAICIFVVLVSFLLNRYDVGFATDGTIARPLLETYLPIWSHVESWIFSIRKGAPAEKIKWDSSYPFIILSLPMLRLISLVR